MIEVEDARDFFSLADLAKAEVGFSLWVERSIREECAIGSTELTATLDDFVGETLALFGLPHARQIRGFNRGFCGPRKPDCLVLNGVCSEMPVTLLSELLRRPERFAYRQVIIWMPAISDENAIDQQSAERWAGLHRHTGFQMPWHDAIAGWDRLLHRPKSQSLTSFGEFAFFSIDSTGSYSFSIVVPHFNHWDIVPEAIQSIERAAVAHRCEIIFVDDASTATPRTLSSSLPMTAVSHTENQGVAGALNTGIGVAQGDFVGWLSADDLFLDNYFTIRDFLFRQRMDLDVLYGDCLFTQHGSERFTRTRRHANDQSKPKLLADLAFNNSVSGISMSVARHELVKLKFDRGNRHAQDAKMWFELALSGLKSASIPVPTAVTRFLGTNYSQVYPDLCSIEAVIGVLDVFLSAGKSLDCSEPDQAEFQQRLTVNLIKALGLNAWDYPKGFGLIRSLVALLLLQTLYHKDWIKRYDQVCIALREAGVSPDRMSLLRQWKFRMREGSAAAHLKRLIKGASDLPLDSRPRIREELDALKARHTGYFLS